MSHTPDSSPSLSAAQRLADARTESTGSSRCVEVVGCVDDRYVKGLAVTLASAAEHLRVGWSLKAHIVDGGMTPGERQRLEATCQSFEIDVVFHNFDVERLRRLPTSHHITHSAYIRLLLGEILPESLDRVLYLDSDLLIRDDLVQLWQQDLGDAWCAAIPDIACPFVDATIGARNLARCGPYMATYRPIANWRRLGLSPESLYFNSGLMLLDFLRAWRREGVAERALSVLHEHRRYVWCWDQYALNVVLAGHWKRMPLRWNCGAHLWDYPSVDAMPLEPDECRLALESPAVIHFTTRDKPWHDGNDHQHAPDFYQRLDRTAWECWRPTPLPFSLSRWWLKRSAMAQKELTIRWRKWRLSSRST